MTLTGGIFIERQADFGILVESPHYLRVACEKLAQIVGGCRVELALDKAWGGEIGYADSPQGSIVLLNAEGSPQAINAVERFVRTGVQVLISIGSCGSTDEAIPMGSFILSLAGVREEGATDGYLPTKVPALADFDLTNLLAGNLRGRGANTLLGVTFTTDTRYRENPDELILLRRRAKVLNIDMETAAVLLTATYHALPVAAANFVVDCPVRDFEGELKGVVSSLSSYESLVEESFDTAIPASLDVFGTVAARR